jgi:hypothetical protein
MSMTEFVDRLIQAIALLEIAEDQMAEAITELQLNDLYIEAEEVRMHRKGVNRMLAGLRNKARENFELDQNS